MWLEFLCCSVFPRHLAEILCPCSWLTSPLGQQGSFPSFLPHSLVRWLGTHTAAHTDLDVLQFALFLLFSSEPKMLILFVLHAQPVLKQETNAAHPKHRVEALHVKRIYQKKKEKRNKKTRCNFLIT